MGEGANFDKGLEDTLLLVHQPGGRLELKASPSPSGTRYRAYTNEANGSVLALEDDDGVVANDPGMNTTVRRARYSSGR